MDKQTKLSMTLAFIGIGILFIQTLYAILNNDWINVVIGSSMLLLIWMLYLSLYLSMKRWDSIFKISNEFLDTLIIKHQVTKDSSAEKYRPYLEAKK